MHESTSYDAWVYSNLQPEERVFRSYPAREPSTLTLKMQCSDKCPDKEKIDESEQVKREDEYLKKCGV